MRQTVSLTTITVPVPGANPLFTIPIDAGAGIIEQFAILANGTGGAVSLAAAPNDIVGAITDSLEKLI